MSNQFILASQSKYKRALISRLQLDIEYLHSDISEQLETDELPFQLVKRLSTEKAMFIANNNVHCWVIGSDQIALLGNKIIGKPEDKNNAIKQLLSCSEQRIIFITGVTLVNKEKGISLYDESIVEVKFKKLTEQQIVNYLDIDEPYDCAGSFKIESLGISLFEWVKSDDPTSLEGLPLITVCKLLRQAGIEPLD